MEKQKIEMIEPNSIVNIYMQAQATNFGTSANEQRHRDSAGHFFRSL
jgi:hypothetical protein